MNDIIEFYYNRKNANNKPNYNINTILEWDDYKLEKEHDWIQWVFPLPVKSKYNPKAPLLNYFDINVFKTDKILVKIVETAFLRILNFYGFTIDPKTMLPKQYKPLYRKKNGRVIGLYSTHNYLRITRILKFLNLIGMKYLSMLFFLAMCLALKSDPKLHKKVVDSGALIYWINTQEYL